MEKDREVHTRTKSASVIGVNESACQLKIKRDMAIEEQAPTKSGKSRKSSTRNKNKDKPKKKIKEDSESAYSMSPSEFKQQTVFEKGIKALKKNRGDSMDSINAYNLRRLLDPENQSFLSKNTRNPV